MKNTNPTQASTKWRCAFSTSYWLPIVLLSMVFAPRSADAQLLTNTYDLVAGWNSVYLHLEPQQNDIGTVLTNLPVESVWTWLESQSSADFISDQNELPWNNPSWRRYFPEASGQGFLSTLFAMRANRPYLIKMTNSAILTITGRPSYRPITWVPDAFNLQGFPVPESNAPTFPEFFAPTQAHVDQPMYRLNPDGLWTHVSPVEPMIRGVAYWVYSQGSSDYTAPLKLELPGRGELDFGGSVDELTLRLTSLDRFQLLFHLDEFESAESDIIDPATGVERIVPLSYFHNDPNGRNIGWEPLSIENTFESNIRQKDLRLGARRASLTTADYQSTIRITDGSTTLYYLPFSVTKTSLGSGGTPSGDPTGLWVGSALVRAVNEPNSVTNQTQPTPTSTSFELRLLLHVDDSGNTSLLKEIIQMWRAGGYITDPATGLRTVDTANTGRHVLLTDDRLIPLYQGMALRDGRPVGRRISSIGFDFEGTSVGFNVIGSGLLDPGSQLSANITLPADSPTNPFRHRYHPAHTNGLPIVRSITLDPIDHEGYKAAAGDGKILDYGAATVGGIYKETLMGLHHEDIHLQGTFLLQRVSSSGELNPTN